MLHLRQDRVPKCAVGGSVWGPSLTGRLVGGDALPNDGYLNVYRCRRALSIGIAAIVIAAIRTRRHVSDLA